MVGDAFVDVLANGVSELPRWNSDTLSTSIELNSGGSAMNSALHLSELGEDVVFHTALGTADYFGSFLRSTAASRRLRMVAQEPEGKTTGSCVVISGENDRTFVTCRGAVDELRAAFDVDGFSHVHLAGYFNCAGLQKDAADLFRRARKSGATTSLGCQHDALGRWGGVGRAPLTTDDAGPDILILSEDEARHIVARMSHSTISSSPSRIEEDERREPRQDALALLASKAAHCVVLTIGAKGALLAALDGDQRPVVLEQRAASVATFVDATGAGDAFAAGFLHGLKQSRGSLRASLRHGCAAGAACVANSGGSRPLDKNILSTALADISASQADQDEEDLMFCQENL